MGIKRHPFFPLLTSWFFSTADAQLHMRTNISVKFHDCRSNAFWHNLKLAKSRAIFLAKLDKTTRTNHMLHVINNILVTFVDSSFSTLRGVHVTQHENERTNDNPPPTKIKKHTRNIAMPWNQALIKKDCTPRFYALLVSNHSKIKVFFNYSKRWFGLSKCDFKFD
jgi:hypothetical protein